MKILVLDSGNSSAYHVMRTVAHAGHEVHLSTQDDAVWSRSKYCRTVHRSPPVEESSRFASYLLDLIQSTQFDLLLFCGDHEAEIVWTHRDEIERHVRCFLPTSDVHQVAFSKNEAYRHAARIGVPMPQTAFPLSREDLNEVGRQIGSPAIVKGDRGSAGSRVRFAANFQDLLVAYDEISELERQEGRHPCVQEYVTGPGFVVHALFHEGRPMAICSHRKLREYPVGRGVTASGATVHHPELDRAAIQFLESLNWNGLAKLDFMLDRQDRRFKFIELDPRVSASIDITRAAGSDQVLMLCDLAAGKRVEPQLRYRSGVRYRWLFPRDVLSVIARPTQLPAFARDFVRRDRRVDVGLLDDPRMSLGALRMLFRYVRRDIRRARARRRAGRARRLVTWCIAAVAHRSQPTPAPAQ